jgi:DNA-binding CsgD family transcriptional regulator
MIDVKSALLGELTELAQTAASFGDLQSAMLARIESLVGCEAAMWGSLRAHEAHPEAFHLHNVHLRAGSEDMRSSLRILTSMPARYDVPEVHRTIRRSRGVIDDRELFSAGERDRLLLNTEVLHPAGIRTFVISEVAFRGEAMSFVTLYRGRGRGFRSREKDLMLTLRGPIALVEAAFRSLGTASVTQPGHLERLDLSPRESQVAALIAQGLQNKEIAALLGTSPATVQKQTIAIYRKARVSGRVHLVALLSRGDASSRVDARLRGPTTT